VEKRRKKLVKKRLNKNLGKRDLEEEEMN